MHFELARSAFDMFVRCWYVCMCGGRIRLPWSRSSAIRGYAKQLKTNDPIPFTKSKARNFRVVEDVMSVEKKKLNRSNYATPLGLGMFAIIIYFGFFRKENENDESILEYLTQDINSKIPEEKRNELPK